MREQAETLQNILQGTSEAQKAGQAEQARAHYGEIIERVPSSIQATAARVCLALMDHNERLAPTSPPLNTPPLITIPTIKPSVAILPLILALGMNVALLLYLALQS